MVNRFGNDHLRQQARARSALFDRLWRLSGRLHRARAGVLLAHVLDDRQLRGDIFVALAVLFADRSQILLAGGAVLFRILEIMHDTLTLEMTRKRLAAAASAFLRS